MAILVGVGLCEMARPDDHDAGNTADTADRGPDAAAESTGCVDSVSEAYVLTKRLGTKDPTSLVRGGVDSLDHGVVALLHV